MHLRPILPSYFGFTRHVFVLLPSLALASAASTGVAQAQTSIAVPADAPAETSPPPSPPPPRAYGVPSEGQAFVDTPPTRRSGLVVGVIGALAITDASGTPLQYEKRNSQYRVDTGTTAAASNSFFVGGAFTDWFSFQVGFTSTSFTHRELQASSVAFLFRLEAWPLFSLGGVWRDLGLGAEFGTGGATIKRAISNSSAADAGSFSLAGVNAFWDAARLWKINIGPFVGYQIKTSDTFSQPSVSGGLRTVLYGGP